MHLLSRPGRAAILFLSSVPSSNIVQKQRVFVIYESHMRDVLPTLYAFIHLVLVNPGTVMTQALCQLLGIQYKIKQKSCPRGTYISVLLVTHCTINP